MTWHQQQQGPGQTHCAACRHPLAQPMQQTPRGWMHQQCAWSVATAPQPARAMSTGTMLGIGLAGLMVVGVTLSTIAGKATKSEPKKTAVAARPKVAPPWVQEVASAMSGASPVRTDASCKKFSCTAHRTSIGEASRAQDKKFPAAIKLLLPVKVNAYDAGHLQPLSCGGGGMAAELDASRRYYLVDDGPLSGNVIVTDPSQTHVLTPQYLLPTTDSGFTARERECAWERLR